MIMLAGFVFANIPVLDSHLHDRYDPAFYEYVARTRKWIPFVQLIADEEIQARVAFEPSGINSKSLNTNRRCAHHLLCCVTFPAYRCSLRMLVFFAGVLFQQQDLRRGGLLQFFLPSLDKRDCGSALLLSTMVW